MKIIDKNSWNRKEIFDRFSNFDYPFYSITIPVDVTNVKKVSKSNQISFYYLMVWICTKAINSIEEFRLRIRGNQIVCLDQTNPSFTDSRKNEELFHIVTMPWEEDAVSFCKKARKKSENQDIFINDNTESDELIYFTCTPWFDFTSLTNEHAFDKNDLIPRLAWGKYYEEKNRLFVHMSIEVNHRMIDGKHLGLLKDAIDCEIAQLSEV